MNDLTENVKILDHLENNFTEAAPGRRVSLKGAEPRALNAGWHLLDNPRL